MFSVMMEDEDHQNTINCPENDKRQIPFEVHDVRLRFSSFLCICLPPPPAPDKVYGFLRTLRGQTINGVGGG